MRTAAEQADVVVVSLHGGVEYLLETDPNLASIATDVVSWGADVVWGHGAHVPQPVDTLSAPHGRTAVVATSLGNFVFDQQRSVTQTGLLLELLVSVDGVAAYRVGRVHHHDLRPVFDAWDPPASTAALVSGEWWSVPDIPAAKFGPNPVEIEGFSMGDVVIAGRGDATGSGREDLVVSYRHPFRSNPVTELFPERDWTDAAGRSAHLGVFDADRLEPLWAAGTLLRPVAAIAVCDGSIALAFDTLDATDVVATGGWTWWDFGFAMAPELPGPGTVACADVDRDGQLEPLITGR